jgi:hypothetical protein
VDSSLAASTASSMVTAAGTSSGGAARSRPPGGCPVDHGHPGDGPLLGVLPDQPVQVLEVLGHAADQLLGEPGDALAHGAALLEDADRVAVAHLRLVQHPHDERGRCTWQRVLW